MQKRSAFHTGFCFAKIVRSEYCGGLDGLEPLSYQPAKTQQRLVKNQSNSSHLWKAYDTLGAFKSSKDVPDNDTVVDEVDETHTLSKIDDSEVLQQIFLEYPFHRSRVLTMLATLDEDAIKLPLDDQ
ncbi:hypothetical protein Tco_0027312 [Tanacetum coccineum]